MNATASRISTALASLTAVVALFSAAGLDKDALPPTSAASELARAVGGCEKGTDRPNDCVRGGTRSQFTQIVRQVIDTSMPAQGIRTLGTTLANKTTTPTPPTVPPSTVRTAAFG